MGKAALLRRQRLMAARHRGPTNYYTFAGEQIAFPIQAAGEAAGLFVRREDAMAGYENRNRVRAARAAHRANGFGPANHLRNFAVASRLAGGNLPQRVPNTFLKFGPA